MILCIKCDWTGGFRPEPQVCTFDVFQSLSSKNILAKLMVLQNAFVKNEFVPISHDFCQIWYISGRRWFFLMLEKSYFPIKFCRNFRQVYHFDHIEMIRNYIHRIFQGWICHSVQFFVFCLCV